MPTAAPLFGTDLAFFLFCLRSSWLFDIENSSTSSFACSYCKRQGHFKLHCLKQITKNPTDIDAVTTIASNMLNANFQTTAALVSTPVYIRVLFAKSQDAKPTITFLETLQKRIMELPSRYRFLELRRNCPKMSQ